MRRPRSPQRLGRSPTVRGCDRRCRARPRGSGGGRRLGSGGGPRRPAGRQGGRALALRPPFGPRRDSWRPVADVTSAAARAHCPRSEAVVIDIRGTSGAAAWLMVRLLVWSARAVAVSGSSCGDKFARANLCTSICCALRERQLYGKGRLFRDCLARPIMTAEVIATGRHTASRRLVLY